MMIPSFNTGVSITVAGSTTTCTVAVAHADGLPLSQVV